MHILITDSGVGGLSVCAYLEHYLRTQGTTEPVRLTFVNAAPSNEAGYNAMASRQQKVDYFDRFLQRVADKYSPDLIYVACNTLSVLLADTGFAKASTIPVRGIVEAGGHRLLREMEQSPEATAVIFATVTTIAEQAYPKLLQGHGIGAERIISQACPNLADVISEDRQGALALERIEHFVQAALGQSDGRAKACLVYMGCTHYGYRKELFQSAFDRLGVQAAVLNPNELVLDDLLPQDWRSTAKRAGEGDIAVEFVTRYKIPEAAIETISFFLNPVSPKTIAAFRHYTYAPDLF
jgi:glutamate racemase